MEWTIGHLLARNVAEHPAGTAIIDGEVSVTWRELQDSALRFAAGLSTLGIGRNSRVAAIAGNNTTAIELLFSLAIGGCVGVPINYGLTLPEIELLLADSDPHAIVIEAAFVARFEPLLQASKARIIVRGGGKRHAASHD